ncbi:hypothetical protein R3X28_05115 [Maribacter sp. TH_r10]|uniref:hypothetical protein n=1 Tax=Maribacter sp. TH_r10 TaxID=3082086 RepID=UPI00295588F9|nr:hypothetical protein [Maribacter sp. TH_r10]MDV7138243.1 hypothetical protein [Maribacter sp. TH_r10]
MSTIKYRNYDLKVIKELLKEIGKHRYEQALEHMQVKQKPLGMKGWYLEATNNYLRLCYKYPSRYVLMLMDVDRYHNIPVKGWERIKVNELYINVKL